MVLSCKLLTTLNESGERDELRISETDHVSNRFLYLVIHMLSIPLDEGIFYPRMEWVDMTDTLDDPLHTKEQH